MTRQAALKVLLSLLGLTCLAGSYPLFSSLFHPGAVSPGDQMILGIYVTIGVFLLLALRDPAANRTLFLCVAWANLAHAAVMGVQAFQNPGQAPSDPVGLGVMALASVALILLAPPKQTAATLPAAAPASGGASDR